MPKSAAIERAAINSASRSGAESDETGGMIVFGK
jgi:hypothetical protein